MMRYADIRFSLRYGQPHGGNVNYYNLPSSKPVQKDFSEKDVRDLIEAIKTKPTAYIDLRGCLIDGLNFARIIGGLNSVVGIRSTPITLNLTNNNINDYGILVAKPHLIEIKTICRIILTANKITDDGAKHFLSILETNHNIVELDVSENNLSPNITADIEKMVQRNQNLRKEINLELQRKPRYLELLLVVNTLGLSTNLNRILLEYSTEIPYELLCYVPKTFYIEVLNEIIQLTPAVHDYVASKIIDDDLNKNTTFTERISAIPKSLPRLDLHNSQLDQSGQEKPMTISFKSKKSHNTMLRSTPSSVSQDNSPATSFFKGCVIL